MPDYSYQFISVLTFNLYLNAHRGFIKSIDKLKWPIYVLGNRYEDRNTMRSWNCIGTKLESWAPIILFNNVVGHSMPISRLSVQFESCRLFVCCFFVVVLLCVVCFVVVVVVVVVVGVFFVFISYTEAVVTWEGCLL